MDIDGDGVRNVFDKCAETPQGVEVDTHGCPKDTDGDGVADYKDKQLITPTECQPSDADGIGECPCPEDSKPVPSLVYCALPIEILVFDDWSFALNKENKIKLSSYADIMNNNPTCRIAINASTGLTEHLDARRQQLAWSRANEIVQYMVEIGNLDPERFGFLFYGGIPSNVNLRVQQTGSSIGITPAPYPNLIDGVNKKVRSSE